MSPFYTYYGYNLRIGIKPISYKETPVLYEDTNA